MAMGRKMSAKDAEWQQKLDEKDEELRRLRALLNEKKDSDDEPLAKRPRVTSSFGNCEAVVDLDNLPLTVTCSNVTLRLVRMLSANGKFAKVSVKADFSAILTAQLHVSMAISAGAGVPHQFDYEGHTLNRYQTSVLYDRNLDNKSKVPPTKVKLHLLLAVRPDAVPDFSLPSALSDLCLKVGRNATEFYVNRAHLSVYSSYFRTMFNGNFVEAKPEAIVLPDVKDSAFELILRMIYPERLKISGDKMAEEVLAAAVFLGIECVTHECEKFFAGYNWESRAAASSGYRTIDKLRLAHHYGLQHLECSATKELSGYEMAKNVFKDTHFHALDHAVQEVVMKKLSASLP